MLILSSSGFSTTQVRLKIGEIIADKTGRQNRKYAHNPNSQFTWHGNSRERT